MRSPELRMCPGCGESIPAHLDNCGWRECRLYRPPLVVSFGAGVDSMAMLVGLSARGERPDAIVFSDTMGEKPETYRYIADQVLPWCTRNGFPWVTGVTRPSFGRGKTGDQSLEEECIRLGNVPSRAFGYSTCADKWKIDPFKWWALEFAAKWYQPSRGWLGLAFPMVRCLGFEFGEERRISKIEEKGMVKRYPLIEWKWDRDRCEQEILDAGLRLPPKSACFFCPSSTKTEILTLAKEHPDLMARALAMESASNATGRWNIKGLGRRFSWGEFLESSEAQRDLFPEQPVESCGVCHEAGDQ